MWNNWFGGFGNPWFNRGWWGKPWGGWWGGSWGGPWFGHGGWGGWGRRRRWW